MITRLPRHSAGPNPRLEGRRRLKALLFKQILAIEDHLRPAVHGNRGPTVFGFRKGERAGGEGVGAQILDHLGGGLDIQDAGLDPGQRVLEGVVDHVRQVTRGKGRGGAGAEIAFGHRDHLDRDAGLGFEVLGELFLLGKALGLFLGGPEADVRRGASGGEAGQCRARHQARKVAFDRHEGSSLSD